MNLDELRSGASNDPEDWAIAGPSFGEHGLPPGMAARIADDIMSQPATFEGDPKASPKTDRKARPGGNPHLRGDGYGEGRS